MKQKEILKTINDLLSLTKEDEGYNDAWDKGYELFNLISKEQLTLTVVVGQSEQLVCDKKCEWTRYPKDGIWYDGCVKCGKEVAN